MKIVALTGGDSLRTLISSDGGISWQYVGGITPGPIYASYDSGVSWSAATGYDKKWTGVTITSNNKIIGITNGDYIYIP